MIVRHAMQGLFEGGGAKWAAPNPPIQQSDPSVVSDAVFVVVDL